MTTPQDPLLASALDDLLGRIRVLSEEVVEEAELLKRTAAMPNDYFGIKMRVSSLRNKADNLFWLAARIDALHDFSYKQEMPSEEPDPSV